MTSTFKYSPLNKYEYAGKSTLCKTVDFLSAPVRSILGGRTVNVITKQSQDAVSIAGKITRLFAAIIIFPIGVISLSSFALKLLLIPVLGEKNLIEASAAKSQKAAVQTVAKPIAKPLSQLSDEEFQAVWKSMQIGSPEASAIQKEMFRRLMGDQGLYKKDYMTNLNFNNLAAYIDSPEFAAHQRSTKVYVGRNLSPEQAKLMANQREPVNIAQSRHYDMARAEKLLGYSKSYFETHGNGLGSNAVVSVYSKTFLWAPPGGNQKKDVAVLSVYAPALDSPQQPRFKHYIAG